MPEGKRKNFGAELKKEEGKDVLFRCTENVLTGVMSEVLEQAFQKDWTLKKTAYIKAIQRIVNFYNRTGSS